MKEKVKVVVREKRRRNRREGSGGGGGEEEEEEEDIYDEDGGGGGDDEATTTETSKTIEAYRPRRSDAVLSCPCCFNIVCMDCQRHKRYPNQFR